MNKKEFISHPIQRHIIEVLTHQRLVRFSDLRLKGIDTNLMTYHLKLLMKEHIVVKLDKEYTLDYKAFKYIPERNESSRDIATSIMFLIQNPDGCILLERRSAQPFIDSWSLPVGSVCSEDISLLAAADRGVVERIGTPITNLRHAGDCYVRIFNERQIVTSRFFHIIRCEVEDIPISKPYEWVSPRSLPNYQLAPFVDQIISRSFFGDDYFFAEFEEEWSAIKS